MLENRVWSKAWLKSNWPLVLLTFISLLLVLDKIGRHEFNNYLIFKFSFPHLLSGDCLYCAYDELHKDYYKYSPSASFLFAPFGLFPDAIGAFLFSMATFSMFVVPVLLFFKEHRKEALKVLWIAAPELFGNVQNFQTNGVLVGLFLLSFVLLEKEKFFWASLPIAIAAHIKLFGLGFALMAFLYPGARRKFLSGLFLWVAVILALPLLVTPPDKLWIQFLHWRNRTSYDIIVTEGLSLAGVLYGFFNWKVPNLILDLVGGLIIAVPFLLAQNVDKKLKQLSFANLMLWLIVFNHKSESCTFIIGMTGVAFWYLFDDVKRKNLYLFLILFVVSGLSSDLVPREIQRGYFGPYAVKVWPILILWVYLQAKLYVPILLRASERRKLSYQGRSYTS